MAFSQQEISWSNVYERDDVLTQKLPLFWIYTASLLIFEQQKYHPTHQSRFCNGVRKNVYFCNSGFWHMGSSGSMANLFRCSLGLCTKKILKKSLFAYPNVHPDRCLLTDQSVSSDKGKSWIKEHCYLLKLQQVFRLTVICWQDWYFSWFPIPEKSYWFQI